MMTLRIQKKTFYTLLLIGVFLCMNVSAQSEGIPEKSAFPVIVEAESGTIGSEWKILKTDDGTRQYVTITTDYNETTGDTDHPGENRTTAPYR